MPYLVGQRTRESPQPQRPRTYAHTRVCESAGRVAVIVERGLRGTGTSVPFGLLGGSWFCGLPPRTCARLPHSPMAERAPFAFKKTPPVCFVGEASGGFSRIPAGQCLGIGNRGRTPARKPTDDGASLHTPLPWRSRPWHTAFATSNAEEHARVHTAVTAKNAISGHIFAIQAAARVT